MNMVFHLPISDELDLHYFHPSEIKDLLNEYIKECRKERITHLRIIHGKGKGILRDRVKSILKKNPYVTEFYPASPGAGFWGATIAVIAI